MKICIPILDNRGLESKVSGHFGSAPFFLLLDTENDVCLTLDKKSRTPGTCAPIDLLKAHELDAVVCKGVGRGAAAKLGQAGISILIADSENVSEVLDAAKGGSLRRFSAKDLCAGHQHGHDHGQGGSHCGS